MSFTPVTITADGVEPPDGSLLNGSLRAKLNKPMRNGSDVVEAVPIVVEICDGAFALAPGTSLQLMANDDEGTTPGVYYEFELEIDGSEQQIAFEKAISAAGPATLTLADLMPA